MFCPWALGRTLNTTRLELNEETHILVPHGIELLQFLGPVSSFLLWYIWKYENYVLALKPRTSVNQMQYWREQKIERIPNGSSNRVSKSTRWNVGSLVPQISFSAIMTWESKVSHSPGPSYNAREKKHCDQRHVVCSGGSNFISRQWYIYSYNIVIFALNKVFMINIFDTIEMS